MAYTTHMYGPAQVCAWNKEVDLNTDTIKVMLVNGYTYSKTHQYKDVSVTNESSGSGYTAGGATIASCTISFDGGTNRATFDGADVTAWSSNTAVATGAVIYNDTPSSNKPLLFYIDFGGTQVPLGLQFSADGIHYINIPV